MQTLCSAWIRGLNTRLDMINFAACYLAARLSGEDNRTQLGIGALMNSRGLMKLIIINIGLQKGIIGPALFSMLVLMAVVTTMMASPVFELVYGRKARDSGELGAISGGAADRPFSRPAGAISSTERCVARPRSALPLRAR